MTGPTHRVYSVCFAYLTAILLFNTGVTQINYYLMIPILLTISRCGAEFPDVDHYWGNVHNKTALNKVINIIIHITGGKHRSWQTHSIDICAAFTVISYFGPNRLYEKGLISEVNMEVMTLILLGFASGWISHMFSDMMTSEGVRLFCWNSKLKIKLVPKKLGKLRFNTGNEWEKFNYTMVKYINIILGIVYIIYPILINEIL